MTGMIRAPRLPDWPQRLSDLIASALKRPFQWGTHDCCLWAADAVQAVTGIDPAEGLRGTYTDARGALHQLRRTGGLLGAGARAGQPITPLHARAGDIGLVRVGGRPLLAVCQGQCWMAVSRTGLHGVDLTAAAYAWRVGDA